MIQELALGAVALLAVRLMSKPSAENGSAVPTPQINFAEGPARVSAAPVAVRTLIGGGTVAPPPIRATGDGTGRFESSRAMTPAQYAANVAFVNANAPRAIGFIPGIGVLNTARSAYTTGRSIFDFFGDFFSGPVPTEQSRTENIDAAVMAQSESVYGTNQAPVMESTIDAVVLADTGAVYGGGYSPLVDAAGQDFGLFGEPIAGSGGGSDGGFSSGGDSPAYGPQ